MHTVMVSNLDLVCTVIVSIAGGWQLYKWSRYGAQSLAEKIIKKTEEKYK